MRSFRGKTHPHPRSGTAPRWPSPCPAKAKADHVGERERIAARRSRDEICDRSVEKRTRIPDQERHHGGHRRAQPKRKRIMWESVSASPRGGAATKYAIVPWKNAPASQIRNGTTVAIAVPSQSESGSCGRA